MSNNVLTKENYCIRQEDSKLKHENKHEEKIEKIKSSILINACNYNAIQEKTKILECNFEKVSNHNFNTQKSLQELIAKQREVERFLEDKIMDTQRECENQLENQDKDYCRRNAQIEDKSREYNSEKEDLQSKILESVHLKKERHLFKKEKETKASIRKDIEAKYSSVRIEVEHTRTRNSELSKILDELRQNMGHANKISQKYRAAIAKRSKTIANTKEKIDQIKSENAKLFMLLEKNRPEAKLHEDENQAAESHELLMQETKKKLKEETLNDFNHKISSMKCRLQRVNDAIQNYEQLESVWKETDIELMKAKSALQTFQSNEIKYVEECDI